MAKASAPGRTKTRLVPPLSFEQASALNTAFLQDMASNLLSAGDGNAQARKASLSVAADRSRPGSRNLTKNPARAPGPI
jgi:hypothetical protein